MYHYDKNGNKIQDNPASAQMRMNDAKVENYGASSSGSSGSSKSDKKVIIWVIVALVAIGVLVGLYFFLKKRPGSPNTSTLNSPQRGSSTGADPNKSWGFRFN